MLRPDPYVYSYVYSYVYFKNGKNEITVEVNVKPKKIK